MSDTTAKYIRLSSEDDDLRKGGKIESNSVTNQRNLLTPLSAAPRNWRIPA